MNSKKDIGRRRFLQTLGTGAVASSALLSCAFNDKKNATSSPTHQGPVPTDKMTYRINPKTGDKVSLLGFGCMRFPTKPDPNDKDNEQIDQEAVNELVDYALAHGVNYFDTSPVYGRGLSEQVTGIALSRHPRNKYFLATKLSNFDPATHSFAASVEMYHNSMKKLQTDYIDYYLLHATGLGGMENFEARYINNGILEFLLKEREAGRIRNLGWSFHGKQEVFDHMLAMDVHWDFVMIQLNYADWKHASGSNINAEYLYGELVKRNIPAIVMEPLLGGRLAKLNDFVTAKLKQREPQASVASWAFRYSGSPDKVLTVLSGMTFKEHMEDNIRTYSPLHPVTNEDKTVLEEVAQMILQYPTIPCTECQYCMPCPYGINIPGIFSHYNKCVNEGNVPKNRQDENYSKARKAFLIGYDRSVPKLRQASHCIGCNKCVPACPQEIKIPEEMARIDKFTEELKQNKELSALKQS